MAVPKTLERPRMRGPAPPLDGSSGEHRWKGDGAPAPGEHPARIGVWLLVGAVAILFGAFSIAYLSRRHSADWSVGPIPLMLWINTAVLLISSVAMEWTRASARWDSIEEVKTALGATTALGIAFLVGQVIAWRQLVSAGIYMTTNPHSAFFYLFTGTHALHLVGGVGGLMYAFWKVRQSRDAEAAAALVGPVATYWHFVDALWIYLFVILFWL